MKIEHKVVAWDPEGPTTGSIGAPEALELGLNELGREGWSTVAMVAAADGTYLVVLTRPSPSDAEPVQVVQLAATHRVRQGVEWLIDRGSQALARSATDEDRPRPLPEGPPR